MTDTVSDATIHLVKATVPALQAHGLTITKRMYERMFRNEEIRDLFNQSHHGETGSQPKALASAVLAYVQNIDNLRALAPAVERIAQKHVGLNGTVNLRPSRQSVRWHGHQAGPHQPTKAAPMTSRHVAKARSRAARYSLAERR
jgi:hypothetical protein